MNIPASYLESISAVYPGISFDHLEFNQDGMVNDVIVVNQELVCRFAREDWGKEILAHETKILEIVKRYVEIQIPELEHIEESFVTYRYIKGEPLSRNILLKLSNTAQERVIGQLTQFHHQLHNIPLDLISKFGVLASDTEHSLEDWLQLYEQVQKTLFPYLWKHQKTWIHELFAPIVSGELNLNYTPALINGDLATHHILFDPASESITGVIDFGTAGIGDPACDLAVLISNYGESIVKRMKSNYPLLIDVIDRARFWSQTIELQWANYALKNQDISLSLAHIGLARDIQPLGMTLS